MSIGPESRPGTQNPDNSSNNLEADLDARIATRKREREEKRKIDAKRLGLPEDASFEDVADEEMAQTDNKWRRQTALSLDLPEDASKKLIDSCLLRKQLIEEARQLGLPDNATAEEIYNKRKELRSKRTTEG